MAVREDIQVQIPDLILAAQWVSPDSGSHEKTPIILLHEGLGSIRQWKDFPEKLADLTGRSILLYDRQGYGNSPALSAKRDPGYLHDYALKELPALLSALEINKPILFGHSDGASIALLFAAHHQVEAVISAAAHVFVEEISKAGIRDAVEVWHSTNLKERLAKYHGDKTEQIFFAWADTWLSEPFDDWNMENHLPDITAPVLTLQGLEDEYGSPEQVHAIARQVSGPATELLIPDCKHIPHLQAEGAVLTAVDEFLSKL